MASHQHLFMFRVAACTKELGGVVVQDFFIYNANNPSSLKALPACTEPYPDYSRADCRLPRPPSGQKVERRLLALESMGLLCGEGEGFAVAELNVYPSRRKVYADICMLHASTSASPGLEEKWNSIRVPILGVEDHDDVSQLCYWQTNTVIPFDHFLCWIDYYRGILLCDVFGVPNPTVSFLRFPLNKFPSTHNRSNTSSWVYRGASVVDAGRTLKFIDIARNDGIGYGPLKPGAGFIVSCHTLSSCKSAWKKEYEVRNEDLWALNTPECLPRDILMFPQVHIDNPNIVQFIVISEFKWALKKMRVVAIDMKTMTVDSFSKYIDGKEDKDVEIQASFGPMLRSSPRVKNEEVQKAASALKADHSRATPRSIRPLHIEL
ncbi:uncharacterized protein LOC119326064 [Triticum dicoccoides]|uniref:uncharacterized protein LOC119326064 n=1 Tax=Triticum dicoccoides TaxID=85692 RepID=UPI001891CB75|nr:uncharacterized protein LOC119326064 [Triticum dicoccoides]